MSSKPVQNLSPVPLERRAEFAALPPRREAHDGAMASVQAFGEIESVAAPRPAEQALLRVAAWNLERCLYPDAAARLLRQQGVALVLLSEMDSGMLRTGQRHTTRDLAGLLGHGYAYALEFLELAPMPAPIAYDDPAADNRLGFHGNGFTSALPFRDPVVIRLAEAADWFIDPPGGQKRIGARMAVAATFQYGGREFVGCSVHLESRADFAGRARQMRGLLDALDAYAGSLPVLIGGDLNTKVAPGGHDDPEEMLFAESVARGYDWSGCNLAGVTTRRSTWSNGLNPRQLDWFCTRGLTAEAPAMMSSVDEVGKVLSDHDAVLLTLRF
ncbi:endonuclease/exonuclease/phosphatase [Roseomonas gilardii subsp. gilardii]|uniref:endonuclease/exonuclease/phosphatase family protein n=1 Tax=Roseomonas gilardii TaxID=257708 RepID=UPI001FF769EA|nr:endonuclease/exonuclease/phosphatase [Roseomonas gilardii]UPG71377.1 endonuclease/exonuclease/phosphatase [Roseomonas gilardii subsp. gilardii]